MRLTKEDGSIPLAILLAIVIAGLSVVLVSNVMQSERNVRSDRSFTEVIQTADAGVQQAYHQLNNELLEVDVGATAGPFTEQFADMDLTWQVERISGREFEVTSRGEQADGVSRTIVATVERDELFYPGAFAETLIGLSGTPSNAIDSYESGTENCAGNTDPTRCWGYPSGSAFGTGMAALGTNGDFSFSGSGTNQKIPRAILYDWGDNPGAGPEADPWWGSRCSGNGCTDEILERRDDPLTFGSQAEMERIEDKLEACEGTDQDMGNWVLQYEGQGQGEFSLEPYSTAAGDNQGSPLDEGWSNYYCAETLRIKDDLVLEGASSEAPVVIFVRSDYHQSNNTTVNCPNCPHNLNQMSNWRSVRPEAGSLQIYIQDATLDGTKGADATFSAQSTFAGVLYAPLSACNATSNQPSGGGGGGGGGGGVHVYGSIICDSIAKAGNWSFHYDTSLSDLSGSTLSVSNWSEDPSAEIAGAP
jgi:hypothetical protein